MGYLPNDDGVLGSPARSFDGLVVAYLGQSALLSPVDVEWALEGWGPDRVMTLCICLVFAVDVVCSVAWECVGVVPMAWRRRRCWWLILFNEGLWLQCGGCGNGCGGKTASLFVQGGVSFRAGWYAALNGCGWWCVWSRGWVLPLLSRFVL